MSREERNGLDSNGSGATIGKNKRPKKGNSLLVATENFTAIDIETTGVSVLFDHIIEISAIRFRGGKAVDKFDSLVNPECELDEFIVQLTGITDDMVATAPKIENVLSGFLEFIGNDVLVGHNINFDINFIYDECENCGIDVICNNYIDTMRLSRRINKEYPNHKLDTLIWMMGLPGRSLHRALGDCELTAACYLKMIDDREAFNAATASVNKTYSYIKAKDLVADEKKVDTDSPLYGQVCVFTGVLDSMTRREAMQLVTDIGGICGDNVTNRTNLLILGNNDYCKSIKDGKSSKQKKAEQLILDGADLKIIPETVFLDMVEKDSYVHEQDECVGSAEVKAYEKIKPQLIRIVESCWLDTEKLSLNKTKEYYSIVFGSYVVARLHNGKTTGFSIPRASNYNEYKTVSLETLDDITHYSSTICSALLEIIEAIPTEFSCCSRYELCSNAKACINPDKKVAEGCSYRKSLSKGKVFFGKNRNVD